MNKWLHVKTMRKRAPAASGFRRFLLTTPLMITLSGSLAVPAAFCTNSGQAQKGTLENQEFSSQDYSYYDAGYDDTQNAKYAKETLSERYRRSLTVLSYNYLAWLKGRNPVFVEATLKSDWKAQQRMLRKSLRSGDSQEISRAIETYFHYLHAVLSDQDLNLLINRHREFRARYRSVVTEFSEVYQMFSDIPLAPDEKSLNPDYFRDCKSADRIISSIRQILHEMELAYNSRPTDEQLAEESLGVWTLLRLRLPLFLQKIYEHALGSPRQNSSAQGLVK